MKRKNIYLLVLILLVIIGLTLFLNYDNILKWRYNRAVENQDCERIYNFIDIEESAYLTKEKYVEMCNLKINNYENKEVEVNNHKVKNEIVDVYENITLYIPSNSNFYLDNKLINTNYVSDENGIYNIFTFDKLFEGEYSIKFNNQVKEEDNIINISDNDLKLNYEYNNDKQIVIVIGYNKCSHCTNLMNFLSTLDKNIIDIKYYEYDNKEAERLKNRFLEEFKKEVEYYPTVIIGDKYILGYSEEMDKEYISAIYNSYRNKIDNVLK